MRPGENLLGPFLAEEFPLESPFILGDEMLEVMEKHPEEHGLLGLARAIDSCPAGCQKTSCG